MSNIKKLLCIFLIVAILIPFLPINAVKADADDQGSSGGGKSGNLTWSETYPQQGTRGLTYAQQTYISRYVRAYVQEALKMKPIPVVYNGVSPQIERVYRDILSK